MDGKKIIFITSNKGQSEIPLCSKPPSHNLKVSDYGSFRTVYSDREYVFKFDRIDSGRINDLSVYINGEKESVIADRGIYRFTGNGVFNYFVFRDKIGLVSISIDIEYVDGTNEQLYSDYISVLIRKDQELELIDMMTDYVYLKQDQLIATDNFPSKTRNNETDGYFINLEAKISLAEEILKLYKDSFGYCSANSRFKTKVVNVVDDSNKLQSVSPQTLQFIATHPEQLGRSVSGGVKHGKHTYVPRKTLIQKNEYSINIYENQVIVSFLKKMLDDTRHMIEDAEQLLSWQRLSQESNSEYIHSSFLIFRQTERTVRDCVNRSIRLKSELETTYNLYATIFEVDELSITQTPRPSPIFRTVPQYNNIYNHMRKWFKYVPYNLERERFMMSFYSGAYLYEIYALAKMLESIEGEGFTLTSQHRFVYNLPYNAKYENTLCNNTYKFERGKTLLTLYYQPVVMSGKNRPFNEIELYRNTSLSLEGHSAYYYAPDYILKVENGGNSKYMILDAKFCNRSYVRSAHISNLTYKYLVSITPRNHSKIMGLVILYGRADKYDLSESLYDYSVNYPTVTPAVDMVPLTAGINTEKNGGDLRRIIEFLAN